MARKFIGLLLQTVLVMSLFTGAVFACSLVAGAGDPTRITLRAAMGYLTASMFLLAGHSAVVFYRKFKNKWIFGLTLGLSTLVIPLSLFLMILSAGTACGEGSIKIALYNVFFQLGALFVQLISWFRGDQSTPIILEINKR
jgi:hypothetical protein